MEKLPTRMSAEALENKIQVLLKKVVVRPVHMEVVMDPIMGRPRGHCYLDFLDSQSSEKALELDGLEVPGRGSGDGPVILTAGFSNGVSVSLVALFYVGCYDVLQE
ncbi:HERC2, partial [Symbiodinium sp. CCMP2592]